jgi:hypothetical protein
MVPPVKSGAAGACADPTTSCSRAIEQAKLPVSQLSLKDALLILVAGVKPRHPSLRLSVDKAAGSTMVQ